MREGSKRLGVEMGILTSCLTVPTLPYQAMFDAHGGSPCQGLPSGPPRHKAGALRIRASWRGPRDWRGGVKETRLLLWRGCSYPAVTCAGSGVRQGIIHDEGEEGGVSLREKQSRKG
nr:hypothetical protein CFP56_50486 [Quercus suber]